MKMFDMLFWIVFIVLISRIVVFIVKSITNFKDKEFNFTVSVKKENLDRLTGLQFEGFCKWLFEKTGEYSKVELNAEVHDKGRDLILTTKSGEEIYVECKRYYDLVIPENDNEDFRNENYYIGREICQKLIGAMVVNNVHKGIIITTGTVHKNAVEYIDEIRKNTSYDIDILTTEDIVTLLNLYCKDEECYELPVTI